MPGIRRESIATQHLDFIRGMAAIAVLIYHVRYRFFLDYADLPVTTTGAKAFYAATSFGHDAVMVFFVLSGYLISSSVLRDLRCEQWSWSKYSSSRLTRLYVVLIPGLVLTLFWDELGLRFFGNSAIYTGLAQAWKHDYIDVSERLTVPALFGNLGFLQGILVPPYGSDGPLWSLSYEFWYYVLFPLAILALVFARTTFARILYGVAAIVVGAFVGKAILTYFPIWLLGTVVFVLPRASWLDGRSAMMMLVTIVSCIVFSIATVIGHVGILKQQLGNSTITMDYITAIGFSMMLYCLLHDDRDSKNGWYSWLAVRLAGISYTLYVVHNPLLCFLRAMLIESEPWAPSLGTVCMACGIGAVAILYAMAVAFLTESRTTWLQRIVKEKLLLRQRVGESNLNVTGRADILAFQDAVQISPAIRDSDKVSVKG